MKKLIFFFILINSCSYPEMIRNEIIYENDFEEYEFENISGAGFSTFNGTVILGNFNNDGFTFSKNNVGTHDYISISFDLYIHGSWDGNFNGFENDDKPDLFVIEFNHGMDLYSNSDNNIFSTTFSNSVCFSNYCLRQSYPSQYPEEYNPKTGSFQVDLAEYCKNSLFGGPTVMYKVEKIFKSSGDAISFRIYDELYQPNAIDSNGNNQQKCDESWSIDNLTIRAINYN